MAMDRRSFLRLLGSGAVGAAIGAELDLERLLWVPKPIITVPAMPSTFVTPDWITRELLLGLQRDLGWVLHNRSYDVDRHRFPDTAVTIRTPARFT